MEIPAKLKILGHEFTIEKVDANKTQGANGETWLKTHEIKINSGIAQTKKESVLLHEIIEIIDSMFGLGLEHTEIECLEEALYCILKENKLHF